MVIAFPLWAGLLGLILGSFYAASALRYVRDQPFFRRRSACPACGRVLRALELVPVVSWVVLRGHCAGCKERISPFYPLVESISGLAAALLAARYGNTPAFWACLTFCGVLLTASAIDAVSQTLPDILTLGGAALVCPLMVWTTALTWRDSLLGALLGLALAGGLHLFFRQVRKKTALGLGDVKLFALLGGACGWQSLPVICLISSLTALAALILLHLRAAGKGGDDPGRSIFDRPIPFGPFLSLSALVYLLCGRNIQLWLLLRLC